MQGDQAANGVGKCDSGKRTDAMGMEHRMG
jgi:hypothetical protein